MHQYDTVSAAVSGLKQRGYTRDFNLMQDCVRCEGKIFDPSQFEITEFHRFEGDSDPADEAIVYGIESNDGWKGVLVNGYGYSEEPLSTEMVRKLQIHLHE